MTFPDAFRAHVLPKLVRLAREGAIAMSDGEASFDEVMNGVMHEARRLGASRLPEGVYAALEDYIEKQVMDCWQGLDAATERVRKEASAHPVEHYSQLAAEMPHLKWTFAAISPEYRAHAIAEANRVRAARKVMEPAHG